ncbi:MAG: pyridoxal-phosphate-dependent aminotransferase family protein [Egibacteraceae bacterium]
MDDEPLVLLNPGPACTSERVRRAAIRADLCHREPEFVQLMSAIRTGLARSLGVAASHEAVLVTGSGTAAMEMAVIGAVRDGRSLLVVRNGVYGDRLARIGRVHGIAVREIAEQWTRPIDPDRVRAALRRHPDIDAVACVHHETTTGLVNPIAAIGQVVAGTGACFLVDDISGTAIEDQDLATVHADLICGTANKGLHGLPGMSFVLLSQAGARRVREAPTRSLYLHAATYLEAQRAGDVPFTPAVQICFALDEAISEYEDEGGFSARTAEYRERAAIVRKGFDGLGLRILLVDEPDRANSVTTLALPDGMSYRELHDRLKARGFVIYAGQGQLRGRFFRVATMGHLPPRALERFLDALEDVLR